MKRLAVIATAALAAALCAAAPASAAGGPYCADGGYERRVVWPDQQDPGNIGMACYWDSGNRWHVDDQEVDNRSLVFNIKDFATGRMISKWDSGGAEGIGTTGSLDHFSESTWVRGRLCLGEYPEVLWSTCQPFSERFPI